MGWGELTCEELLSPRNASTLRNLSGGEVEVERSVLDGERNERPTTPSGLDVLFEFADNRSAPRVREEPPPSSTREFSASFLAEEAMRRAFVFDDDISADILPTAATARVLRTGNLITAADLVGCVAKALVLFGCVAKALVLFGCVAKALV